MSIICAKRVFNRLLRKSWRRSALLSILKYASAGLPSHDSLATPVNHPLMAKLRIKLVERFDERVREMGPQLNPS